MFLVVFVTLAISILGLFTQVFTLQAAKMYHAQNVLAQTMLVWHGTAVRLAQKTANLPTNIGSTVGCRMTSATATAPATCNNSSMVVTSDDLPPGYSTGSYSFFTILYEPSTSARYVVTFAAYADGNGFIRLPDSTGATTGFSLSDLRLQLANISNPGLTFGTVTSLGTLTVLTDETTSLFTATTASTISSFAYTIPTSIPVGAVAVISSAI